jgi:hypothetical protein
MICSESLSPTLPAHRWWAEESCGWMRWGNEAALPLASLSFHPPAIFSSSPYDLFEFAKEARVKADIEGNALD